MDILERIVEAVANKLILVRLQEAGLNIAQAKAGLANARAKRLGREAGAGKKFGHTGQAQKVDPLSSEKAGATGNQRGRFSDGGDLSSGTKEDPFNKAARNKPIKPELSKTEGPKGGKEGKRGVEENIIRIANIILEKKGRCWKGYKPTPGVKPYAKGSCQPVSEGKSPAWQRSEGKNPEGGLNAKGRASAKAQGHNLKPPVSAEQAKKSKKSAGRRASFCARMSGHKKKNTSSKTANDPNSRINKALRKWDC